jgi:hypothetical protein
LRVRWLWLQRTDLEHLWAAMSVKVDHVMEAFFQTLIRCLVGDGKSTWF